MFIELTVVKRTITESKIKGAKPHEEITEHVIVFNPDQIVAMERIEHPEVGEITMISLSNGTGFPVRETPKEIGRLSSLRPQYGYVSTGDKPGPVRA